MFLQATRQLALHLGGVGLAPSRQRNPAPSFRSLRLGFLGPPADEGWIVLDFLDSFVRIEVFQWVTRLEAGKTFRALFPLHPKRRNEPAVAAHAEAQDCSWGKLNLFSDFLQEIVVRAVSFQPLQSKSHSL
jgi:hypothetical protein